MKKLSSILIKNKDFYEPQIAEASEIDDRLHLLVDHIDKKYSLDLDPQELEGSIERLDTYQKLKKKFGGSVESMVQSQVEFIKEREEAISS